MQRPAFWHKVLLSLVITLLGAALILRILDWHIFLDAHHQLIISGDTTLEGSVHFTGLEPDASDQAQLKIWILPLGTSQPETTITLPPQQDVVWQWVDAHPGVNYQVQAALFIDNKEIKKSGTLFVSAPATHVHIPLDLDVQDLPHDVIEKSEQVITGTVTANGYLPPGSSLRLLALHQKDVSGSLSQVTAEVIQRGTVLATISSPQPQNTWRWDAAKPQQDYMVVAVLQQQNKIIGVSNEVINVNAGDNTANFTINSSATPAGTAVKTAPMPPVKGVGQRLGVSTQAATISGTVYINGPKQANTSLLMLWRTPGQQNYNVIGRYENPAVTGTAWQWTQAELGAQYEILAVLQVNEQNTSSAPNPITVSAPATQVNFTLNTYYVIPSTQTLPFLQTCLRKDSDNFYALIDLPRIQGAGNYWLGVGNDHNQSNVFNQTFPAGDNNADQIVRVVIQQDRQHYMRYSYATCVNCSNIQNFAPPSAEVAFTCQ